MAAIKALQNGIYVSQNVQLISSGNEQNECPTSGKTSCASVVKYILINGKVVSSNWVYLPKAKKWVQLQNKSDLFSDTLVGGDLYSDGKIWSTSGLNLSTAAGTVTADAVNYKFGESEFKLYSIETSKEYMDSLSEKFKFSTGAKSYLLALRLVKGQYINLKEAGFWKGYDDGAVYSSLAKFRQAHTVTSNPVCFVASNWDQGIVFNAKTTGANLYTTDSACKGELKSNPAALEEGVKTIKNNQVIYLSQKKVTGSLENETSSQQFLWAMSLSDAGKPVQGKSYQVNYTNLLQDVLFNKEAILDWLVADHQYDKKIALP